MNTPTVPDGQTPPPLPPQYRDPRYGAYGDYDDYGDYGEFGTAPYPAPQPDSQPYPPRYAQPDALDLPPLDIDTPLPPTVPSTPIARPAPPSAPRDIVPAPRPIPPAIAAPATRPINRLRRQRGIFTGVCGGLGTYFNVSPWWFRLLFILLAMPGGLPGFLPYIILALIIPPRDR
jgi:phage shock protein PspC (stress-responsive transcriptional regulator)